MKITKSWFIILALFLVLFTTISAVNAYDKKCTVLYGGTFCFNGTDIIGVNMSVQAINVINPIWLNLTDQRYNETTFIINNNASMKSYVDNTFYFKSNPYNFLNSTSPLIQSIISNASSSSSTINSLVTNTSNLQSNMNSLVTNVTNLQTTTSNLSTNVTNLQTTTNSLVTNTTNLQTVTGSLATNLTGEISNRQGNDSDLSDRIDIVNSTALGKASPGNCPAGQVVVNTTTSGVQCTSITASTADFANYSQYINLSNAQDLNDSALINAVNTTLNIQGLGFNTTAQLSNVFAGINTSTDNASWNESYANTLYLNKSDQRYNETSLINNETQYRIGNDSLKVDKTATVTTIGPLFVNGSATAPIDGGFTLSMVASNSTSGGYLTAVDWNSFNNKLNASDQRYNDSALINSVNTTANIQGLGFNTTTQLNTVYSNKTYVDSQDALKINRTGDNGLTGNYNITTGNLTVSNGYIAGQPLTGMLGSGIIYSTQGNALSEVNITCSGLTCSYNNFTVRLASGTSNTAAKYCEIQAGSKAATNNAHNVFYIDSNCAVQVTTISTWFNSLITVGSSWDFANMVCYNNACEVINGIGLEQRRMMKQRIINFDKNHLSITSGLGRTTNTWPNFTISSGNYIFLMDVVPTTSQTTGTAGKVEVISPNGTGWVHSDQASMNFTYCQNSTDSLLCSPTNRWRRVFFFIVGWNETTDNTGIHQLLASNSISYTSEANCLDTNTNPLTYTLPDYYVTSAVPVWAYCVRPTDTAWSGTGWIDLRTVKVGSVTSTSSTVYVPYVGASQNVDINGYNMSASNFFGSVNASNIQNPYWLNATDQRYNDSASVNAVNTTLNIQGLGFNTTSQLNTVYPKLVGNNIFTGTNYINTTLNIMDGAGNNGTTIQGDTIWTGTLYVVNISSANIVNPVTVNGSYIPVLSDTFYLGNSSRLWKSVYATSGLFTNVNSTNDIYEEGVTLSSKYNYTPTTDALNTSKAQTGSSSACTNGIANITLKNNAAPAVTCAAAQGDITGVTAGTGMTGGGSSGTVTLNWNATYGANALGNWTADKTSYNTTTQNNNIYVQQSNLVSAVGNWSADKGGYPTGSGSSNYLPYWSNSTNLGSSGLYKNGNYYALGETNPSNYLEINGSGTDNVNIILKNSNASGTTGFGNYNDQGTSNGLSFIMYGTGYTGTSTGVSKSNLARIWSVNSTMSISTMDNFDLVLGANNTKIVNITKQGIEITGNLTVSDRVIISKSPSFYIWYYNATTWDCYNGTGTIYNRGNSTLTC